MNAKVSGMGRLPPIISGGSRGSIAGGSAILRKPTGRCGESDFTDYANSLGSQLDAVQCRRETNEVDRALAVDRDGFRRR
jgi:hypothetical protein